MILRITDLTGATREVRANLADKIAWEAYARKAGFPLTPAVRNAGKDNAEVDVSSFPVDTWHAFLAWQADTRAAGVKRPPFGTWLDDVDEVGPAPKEEDVEELGNPTPAGPSPAS